MIAPAHLPITRTWADFIASHNYDVMSDEARDAAKRGIADCVGCIISGIDTDVGRHISKVATSEVGKSHVWGGTPATARNAALANGTLGHAQDIDDCIDTMRGHPSVPVLPAVLAVADESGAETKAVIAAYAIGIEIEGRIGKATITSHPEKGWHTTLTLGTLGATAAAANLLNLNSQTAQSALGLAASMASGLRVNFGTMAKPLHAGLAAQNGVFAVKLALAGITASSEALEGRQGFFELFSGEPNDILEDAISDLGRPYQVVDPGINFKLYPSCDISHLAIDVLLDGVASDEIDVGDIDRVNCGVGYRWRTNMIYDEAKTGLQGKFCLQYCIAAALHYRKVGFSEFEDDAVKNPAITDLLRKINVYIHPHLASVETLKDDFTDVEIMHRSGKVFHKRIKRSKGHPENPLSWDEHFLKFEACVSPRTGAEGARNLWGALRNLEAVRLADLYRFDEPA